MEAIVVVEMRAKLLELNVNEHVKRYKATEKFKLNINFLGLVSNVDLCPCALCARIPMFLDEIMIFVSQITSLT